MKHPLANREEQLDAVIRTAQYLAGLDPRQDVWAEFADVAVHFLHAELAAFAARRPDGRPVVRRCTAPDDACRDLEAAAAGIFSQVLESGFLASERLSLTEEYALVFLPLTVDGRVTAVMALGHRGAAEPSRDTLNIYLAVAGLFSSTLTRLSSQHRFFAMADNVPEMLFQLVHYPDGNFQFTYASGGSRAALDLSPQELLENADRFFSRLLPDERLAFEQVVGKPKGRLNRILRWQDREGRERHLLFNAMHDPQEDGSTVWDGAVQDITEHERLEEERKQYLLRIEESMEATVEAMASTIEMRDPYTAGHQRRVADLTKHLGEEMGLSSDTLHGITLAASIHDIGKIHIPAEILSHPGKLGWIEFELVKTHSQVGYDILKVADFPWPVAQMVLQHHERMDGTGYPKGLRGEEILLGARIIAVADVVESIASFRPYRPAFSVSQALEEISLNRGTLYDAPVVDACLRLFLEKEYRITADETG
jgi:HD-GYP domain-containing protein (c-di-GMP phosphodiesterase class II)